MRHFFELLAIMTKREPIARYKNTLFGFLWVVVNPLIQTFVIGFVFRFFVKEPMQNYYLYLLVGLLVWNFFSLSLSKATPSIVNERNLIKKARFESEVIPISIVLANSIHLVFAILIILIPILAGKIITPNNLPNLVIGVILLLVFATGISLLTSALNVQYRDINFFVQAALVVWFYATPIVYPIHVIPRSLIWIWRLNPMTSITQLFQNALVSAPAPGIGMFTLNFLIIVTITVLGILVFKKQAKNFDDWV
jgi:ABC-2 type transport system permease protein